MKLRCIIIDDEPRAHAVLTNYIFRLSYLELTQTCNNAIEAYEYLRNNSADLIFLDINMPEVDGFALLDMVKTQPMVIITTAYTDHALKSYDYNVIDYLHKPIRFERFVIAVEKALKWKQVPLDEQKEKSIDLKIDGQIHNIDIDSIIYIESVGNYVKIITKKKVFMSLITTKELESKLANTSFVRIHKSFLVNGDYVNAISGDEMIVDSTRLPIGKTYKRYIQEMMQSQKFKHN